jgi:hypothetical protein
VCVRVFFVPLFFLFSCCVSHCSCLRFFVRSFFFIHHFPLPYCPSFPSHLMLRNLERGRQPEIPGPSYRRPHQLQPASDVRSGWAGCHAAHGAGVFLSGPDCRLLRQRELHLHVRVHELGGRSRQERHHILWRNRLLVCMRY